MEFLKGFLGMIGPPGSCPRRRRMTMGNETHPTDPNGPLDGHSRCRGKQHKNMLIDTRVRHIGQRRGLGRRNGGLILRESTNDNHHQPGHYKRSEYGGNTDDGQTQTLLHFGHALIPNPV